ncbi:hypothetical protein PVAP13_7KG147100 [Panicum virgatum]|uniref:Uncharacterized protein n=1 Tax=Panicum virgatum TaxID=38727 RepID=A0A8T0QGU9_PANVG|nr:hypothetical protein PVAP13_7KG147100 [Panicum virgatum]
MSFALLLCAYGVRLPRFPGTRCNLVVGTPGMLPLPLAVVLSVSTACSSCCSTWFGHRCLTAPPLWIWWLACGTPCSCRAPAAGYKIQESVHVSCSLILAHVMDSLKLKVHSSGYDTTLQGLNMETAWMHVDLPCGNRPGTDTSIVIFGTPQPSQNEADESVCQAVLNYYCSARDVNIDNFSYSILKMKQE